jgi:hypothetical protein
MGALAFNPYLQMSTLAHWGHNSASLNNQQWHGPIGTTEPSRRNMYDRAFRGTIRMDGTYTSIHTYGYNSNVGDSFTLTDVDYAQWNRARTLHTFLLPEAAMGAGLVIGNSYLSNPASTHFAADPAGATETQAVMRSLGLLERAGVSVPYSANALSLEKWKGTSPLVVLNLQKFTPEEINILRSTLARGVHVAALYSGSEDSHLSPDAASLFGVDVDGKPAAGGKVMGTIGSGQIISKDNALFIPLDPMAMDRMQVDSIAPLLIDQLKIPVSFGAGSTGYGFLSNGRQFIVVEDWAEIGRVIQLRLKSDSASLAAINVNDHASLLVKREGTDWVIDVPTRPGDGNLICVQEQASH